MIYIVLSGGIGSRLANSILYSKPLNLINGTPSICYCLESIPENNIYIILNRKLKEYNFETLLPHLNIKKNIIYIYLDNDTRGPIETAYLGLKMMNIDYNEQICIIDNDTIYNLNDTIFPKGNFICYSSLLAENNEKPYCFIKCENDTLTEISEKKQISNTYACGIYGFESAQLFLDKSKELLSNISKIEYYMSTLYAKLLIDNNTNNDIISCIQIKNCICLGTFDDIRMNNNLIPFKKKRFCFDIDNTILKYRTKNQTYKDCEIIEKQVFLMKKLKEKGHTIILYTARGMKTANNNLGICLKNVAKDTFENLEKNNIEYDEIYFGKPEADFYIDDKGYNPYLNIFDALGFNYLNEEYAKIKAISNVTNKFNYIYRNDNIIIKRGTNDTIEGEAFFYNSIKNTSIHNYFPQLYNIEKASDYIILKLEYINGVTLFDLLKNGLFFEKYMNLIIESIENIHNLSDIPINISKDDVYKNYIEKLKIRITDKNNYPFDNTYKIISIIEKGVHEYIYNNMTLVSVVHGDSWFSNTLLTVKNNIIFLDMKGNINGIFTTNGDSLTDYAKMLQSLFGFDYIVNNIENYDKEKLFLLRRYFLNEITKKYRLKDIYIITACLISKTFHFLNVELSIRYKLWNIVESLCINDDIF